MCKEMEIDPEHFIEVLEAEIEKMHADYEKLEAENKVLRTQMYNLRLNIDEVIDNPPKRGE